MFAAFSSLPAPVPDKILENPFSLLISKVNKKQLSLYEFGTKNTEFVIPYTSNLEILTTQNVNALSIFTEIEKQVENLNLDFIPVTIYDDFLVSVLSPSDDINNLNSSVFNFGFTKIQQIKKVYPTHGFLFIKTLKKNTSIYFLQDMLDDKFFIPTVSIGNTRNTLTNLRPSLLYTTTGELVTHDFEEHEDINQIEVMCTHKDIYEMDVVLVDMTEENLSSFESYFCKKTFDTITNIFALLSDNEKVDDKKSLLSILSKHIKTEADFKNNSICAEYADYTDFLREVYLAKKSYSKSFFDSQKNKRIDIEIDLRTELNTRFKDLIEDKKNNGILSSIASYVLSTVCGTQKTKSVYYRLRDVSIKFEDIIF